MKRGKIIISVTSIVLSIIIVSTGCSSPTVTTDESGTGMTKAEWINMLAEEFELKNCVEQKPYFSDVTSNDEYFVAVQSCAEWDIIEKETYFNPDKHVVNTYAMITGVKAIGLDLINHTAEGKGVNDNKSIIRYFMLHNMDIVPDEPLTEESAKSVLDTLSDIYSSLNMEQTVEYQLFDNVVQMDESQIQMEGNQATVTDERLGVGSIIYTEPSSQYPTGRAVQITAIDGKTATIEDVEEKQVLESADIVGSFAPEILNLHDENWNLELIESPEDMRFDSDSEPIITYLGKAAEQPNTTNTDFERHVNLGDVWISLSNKLDPNLEVKGKMCLSDLTVDLVFKMKSKSIKEAYVSFSAVIKFQVSVSGKAEKELLPFSIPLKIAGIVGGEIKVTPKIGISGTATLELSTTFSEGCTYKEGAFPKFFKKLTKPEGKQSFKAQAYVNAKIVLFAAFIAWDLFDVGFETGGTAEAAKTKTGCLDVCVYWSFSAFVNSDKSLLGMLGVKMAWDIFDKDNTPLKKNMHIENGEVVDECTIKSNNTKNSTTANQGVDSGNWRQAYINYLKKYMNEVDNPESCGFSLVYIDNDDTPELVIRDGDAHYSGASVYTCMNSKVVTLVEDLGGTFGIIGYVERKGLIYRDVMYQGRGTTTIYKIEAGTCKELISLYSDGAATPEGMTPDYKINDKSVSKEEYDEAWAEYENNNLSYSSDDDMALSLDAIESINNY